MKRPEPGSLKSAVEIVEEVHSVSLGSSPILGAKVHPPGTRSRLRGCQTCGASESQSQNRLPRAQYFNQPPLRENPHRRGGQPASVSHVWCLPKPGSTDCLAVVV